MVNKGERLDTYELSSLDHTLPFSQGRKWKKANRAGVLFVELWIGWSVAPINLLSRTMFI